MMVYCTSTLGYVVLPVTEHSLLQPQPCLHCVAAAVAYSRLHINGSDWNAGLICCLGQTSVRVETKVSASLVEHDNLSTSGWG